MYCLFGRKCSSFDRPYFYLWLALCRKIDKHCNLFQLLQHFLPVCATGFSSLIESRFVWEQHLNVLIGLVNLNWCGTTLDLCPYKGFVARARFGEWIYKKERKKVFDRGYFSEKAVLEKEEKQEENSTCIERKCSGTKSPNGIN